MINNGQPRGEPWETPATMSVYSLQYLGFGNILHK